MKTNARLNKWLKHNGMTQAAFAACCGCSRATVNYWVVGRYTPSLKMALAIEIVTGGAVRAGDWR